MPQSREVTDAGSTQTSRTSTNRADEAFVGPRIDNADLPVGDRESTILEQAPSPPCVAPQHFPPGVSPWPAQIRSLRTKAIFLLQSSVDQFGWRSRWRPMRPY